MRTEELKRARQQQEQNANQVLLVHALLLCDAVGPFHKVFIGSRGPVHLVKKYGPNVDQIFEGTVH